MDYDLLDDPFKANLDKFSDSVTKRKILKKFHEQREKLILDLYKDNVESDKRFLPYAVDLYNRLKPLLIHAYHEEYPNQKPTIKSMESWIQSCAVSCNLMHRIRERNMWSKLWKLYVILMEADLITIDDDGNLI